MPKPDGDPFAAVRGVLSADLDENSFTSISAPLDMEPKPKWFEEEELRLQSERLKYERLIREVDDHIEAVLALRDEFMRQEGRAQEKAARHTTRAEAGQKQPGRRRIRGGNEDFENLSQLRSEQPGQSCEAQFRLALLKKGYNKDTSRRRYVLADARWEAVHGRKNPASIIDDG
jgi:hypothetical protein